MEEYEEYSGPKLYCLKTNLDKNEISKRMSEMFCSYISKSTESDFQELLERIFDDLEHIRTNVEWEPKTGKLTKEMIEEPVRLFKGQYSRTLRSKRDEY